MPITHEIKKPGVTSETDPIVGAVNGIVKADGAGNIVAASATSPIAITAGVISIANSAADGATKGAAAFAAADFTALSGVISLAGTHNPLALQVFS